MLETGTQQDGCIVEITYTTVLDDPIARLVGYLRFFEWEHTICTASPLHPEKVGQGVWSCQWCFGEKPNHEDWCCWHKINVFIDTLGLTQPGAASQERT